MAIAYPKSLRSIHNGTLINTLNQMGFMYTGPSDEYVNNFIRFSATAKAPVADLGCAFGHKTRLLLEAGASTVIANDLAPEHLEILRKSLSPKDQHRVILIPGDAVELCGELAPAVLSGILAANWLHFLDGDTIRRAFRLFYRALQPGGLLMVVTASLKCGLIREMQEELEERKRDGDEWPGWIANSRIGGTQNAMLPGFMMFLDPEQLEREAKLAGFEVKKVSYVSRAAYPDYYRLDGREASGLLAIKPM